MYGKIVCKDKNPERLGAHFINLIKDLVILLNQCVDTVQLTQAMINTVKQVVSFLSTIFSNLEYINHSDEKNPIIAVYKDLHPIIMKALKRFYDSEKIVEEVCFIVKFTMRSIKGYFLPYLKEFILQVVAGYKASSLSTYLYCGEFIVSVFNEVTTFNADKNPEVKKMIEEMFNFLGMHTFEILGKGGYTNYPNNVEDFFGMCMRFTNYASTLLFNSAILPNLLQFSIAIIGFDHLNAAKALYLFLNEFFKHFSNSADKTALEDKKLDAFSFVLENGPLISNKLIKTLCSAPYQGLHEHIIDILTTIRYALPKSSTNWLIEAIQLVTLKVILGA